MLLAWKDRCLVGDRRQDLARQLRKDLEKSQQDTISVTSTYIGGVPKSEFAGSQKGGG